MKVVYAETARRDVTPIEDSIAARIKNLRLLPDGD